MLESRNKLHTIKLWFSKGYKAVDWWSPNAIIMTQNVFFEQQNIMLQLGLTSWEPSIILPLRKPQFCTACSAEMHTSPDLQKGHPEVSKTLPAKESEYLVLTLKSCACVSQLFGFPEVRFLSWRQYECWQKKIPHTRLSLSTNRSEGAESNEGGCGHNSGRRWWWVELLLSQQVWRTANRLEMYLTDNINRNWLLTGGSMEGSNIVPRCLLWAVVKLRCLFVGQWA